MQRIRSVTPFTFLRNYARLKFLYARGWSGGAMVLGKLPVPGRPTIWITVGQGLVVLGLTAL